MNTAKTYLRIEILDDDFINLDVSGNGDDLVQMMYDVMVAEPAFRKLIESSLMAVMNEEGDGGLDIEENEGELVKILSKMKMGEA